MILLAIELIQQQSRGRCWRPARSTRLFVVYVPSRKSRHHRSGLERKAILPLGGSARRLSITQHWEVPNPLVPFIGCAQQRYHSSSDAQAPRRRSLAAAAENEKRYGRRFVHRPFGDGGCDFAIPTNSRKRSCLCPDRRTTASVAISQQRTISPISNKPTPMADRQVRMVQGRLTQDRYVSYRFHAWNHSTTNFGNGESF